MAGPGLGPEGTAGRPGAAPGPPLAAAGNVPAATAAAVRHSARNEAIRGRIGAGADSHIETSRIRKLRRSYSRDGRFLLLRIDRKGFGDMEGSERTGSRGSPPTLDSCVGLVPS